MGISEYRLVGSLPAELQSSLPSIAQIEEELADMPAAKDPETPQGG